MRLGAIFFLGLIFAGSAIQGGDQSTPAPPPPVASATPADAAEDLLRQMRGTRAEDVKKQFRAHSRSREEMMRKYDANGNGKLDPEERVRRSKDFIAERRALYREYDWNKNGKLEGDERGEVSRILKGHTKESIAFRSRGQPSPLVTPSPSPSPAAAP